MTVPEKQLDRTLSLSYGFEDPSLPSYVSEPARDGVLRGAEPELVEEGSDRLGRAMDRCFADASREGVQVLSLSGGIDSRTVLGGLLERFGPSRIHTITYGVPGTWDYELGQRVADVAGVDNTAVDLREAVDWTEERVRSVARGFDQPNRVFEGVVYAHVREVARDLGGTLWNGFMGDALAGAHIADVALSWSRARQYFVQWNSPFKLPLAPAEVDRVDLLPSEPWVDPGVVPFDDQLDFALRQENFIRPLVAPDVSNSPFVRDEWVSFVLSLPREHRRDRALYKRIVTMRYPDLFAVGTETNDGAPLECVDASGDADVRTAKDVDPNLQFLPFSKLLRGDGQFASLVHELVEGLYDRGVETGVDPRVVWRAHRTSDVDFDKELRTLASLEAFLREHESRDW